MDSKPTKCRVAAAHAAPIFMDKQASLAKVITLIKTAATDSINYLVFPETFVPGYPYFIECYPPLKQVGALAEYGRRELHQISHLRSPKSMEKKESEPQASSFLKKINRLTSGNW